MTQTPHQVKRIAIIGAGACGLVAAKYLVAERCFDKIDIFEQQNCVGGVWNLSPASDKEHAVTVVPAEDPNVLPEEPVWHPCSQSVSESGREATFITPLYHGLETNIPNILMQFSDLQFEKSTQLFPKFESVNQYLQTYSADIKHLIQFQTQVIDIKLEDKRSGTWAVTRKHLPTSTTRTDIYDAVVAANGHYNVPYLPSIKGITAWNHEYPGSIVHSKFYSHPEPYTNKKVIVVGNSASGLDIGSQISQVCRSPLLSSVKSESYFIKGSASDRKEYPPIVEFLSPTTHNRAVRFSNGEVEKDIDAIIYCTGYLYSYPFLPSLDPPVITDGARTLRVYQHLFYIEQPTLVFPGLNQKVIPFPQSENQSAVFARMWSGRLELPSKEEMYKWEAEGISARGNGKAFHVLAYPLDADYLNFMHDWAAKAQHRPELENDGNGKLGSYWNEKQRWLRSQFPNIKQSFAALGPDRESCRLPEDLGYDFDAWKREQEAQP
ncbi:hypothetical protein FQN57_000614 [Myotisia sp. PD_48]|nr:hypothetical protein FQN57_000614 [Myotisia sp. PD_48]